MSIGGNSRADFIVTGLSNALFDLNFRSDLYMFSNIRTNKGNKSLPVEFICPSTAKPRVLETSLLWDRYLSVHVAVRNTAGGENKRRGIHQAA